MNYATEKKEISELDLRIEDGRKAFKDLSAKYRRVQQEVYARNLERMVRRESLLAPLGPKAPVSVLLDTIDSFNKPGVSTDPADPRNATLINRWKGHIPDPMSWHLDWSMYIPIVPEDGSTQSFFTSHYTVNTSKLSRIARRNLRLSRLPPGRRGALSPYHKLSGEFYPGSCNFAAPFNGPAFVIQRRDRKVSLLRVADDEDLRAAYGYLSSRQPSMSLGWRALFYIPNLKA